MKENDRGERKLNESEETEEIKTFPPTLTCCKDSRPCPTVSRYWLDALVTKIHDTFASPNYPHILDKTKALRELMGRFPEIIFAITKDPHIHPLRYPTDPFRSFSVSRKCTFRYIVWPRLGLYFFPNTVDLAHLTAVSIFVRRYFTHYG